MLRRAIVERLKETPFLPGDMRPSDAVTVDPPDAALLEVLTPVLRGLLPAAWSRDRAALDVLGVRRLELSDVVDLLVSSTASQPGGGRCTTRARASRPWIAMPSARCLSLRTDARFVACAAPTCRPQASTSRSAPRWGCASCTPMPRIHCSSGSVPARNAARAASGSSRAGGGGGRGLRRSRGNEGRRACARRGRRSRTWRTFLARPAQSRRQADRRGSGAGGFVASAAAR